MQPDKEKYSGLILGAIAGDCLGIPYIYMKADALFEIGRHLQWQIGMPGECSHLIYASLGCIAKKGFRLDHLVRAYWNWAQNSLDMSYVMSECFGHTPKTVTVLQEQAQKADYGSLCSGLLLIRQIPLVCAGLAWEDEKLCQKVYDECRLTHTDEECIEYVQLYALCLRDILLGKSRLEIWDHLFAVVKSREVYRTLLSSYYEKPSCDSPDYSHGSVTFGMAMYHFWHNTPVSCAIRSAVLAGGATDVNASATGALCGAFQGVNAIPESWRNIILYELEPPHTQMPSHAIQCIEKILACPAKAERPQTKPLSSHRMRSPQNKECAPYAQSA
ncbi:MAG: ADP-ribosylglycohydrolase family protein [Proteobacteria bacterium]|nr:ADP-ribosylglycohydrolase family protein [Pseudomonadota bacterium]